MNGSYERQKPGPTCNCSISSFKQDVYPACYLFIFAIGLMGNLISLYCFLVRYMKKRRCTSVTLYMVNLLVSDLMLILSLPFRATYYIMGTWVLGDVTCRIISCFLYINMYSSIYFLTVLSVMRYLAVSQPFRYYRLQDSRSAWVVCFLIWAFVSLVSAPLLKTGVTKHNESRTNCLDLAMSSINTIYILNYITLIVGFVLPVSVILLCYVFVVRSLLKPMVLQQNKRPNYRKSCALVVIVTIIFLVCFLPYHVARTIFLHAELDFGRSEQSCWYIEKVRKAAVVTHCLAAGNSCLDPVLYFIMGKIFCTSYCKEAGKLSDNKNEGKPVNLLRAEQQEVKIKGSDL